MITKNITYDNIDCLGNTLTHDKPKQYNLTPVQSSCFYGHGNTELSHITLGKKSKFSNVTAIEVDCIFYGKNGASTFFSNIINSVATFCRSGANNGFELYDGTYKYLFTSPVAINLNEHYHIRVEYKNNDYILTVNGQNCTYVKSISSFPVDDIAYIGIRNRSGTKSTPLYTTSIWNFRCYNTKGDLVHHYPLSEGAGRIVYDTVGGIHGNIKTSNIYSVWNSTTAELRSRQNYYHYNLTEGYVSIDGDDHNRFTNSLKIPLKDPTDVLVLKDSWESNVFSVGGWGTSATNSTYSINNDGNLVIKITDGTWSNQTYIQYSLLNDMQGVPPRLNSIDASNHLDKVTGFFLNINPKLGESYRYKTRFRIKQFEINEVATIPSRMQLLCAYCGGMHTGLRKDIYNPSVGENAWTEIDQIVAAPITGTGNDTVITVVNGCLFSLFNDNFSSTDIVNAEVEFDYFEIYRVTHNTYHPPVPNGHNGAETRLDLSGGIDTSNSPAGIIADSPYGAYDYTASANFPRRFYIPEPIKTTDRFLGASGVNKKGGWTGAMEAADAANTANTVIHSGMWRVNYSPSSMSNPTAVTYINNYQLTDEEKELVGYKDLKGITCDAVAISRKQNSIMSSAVQNVALAYNIPAAGLTPTYSYVRGGAMAMRVKADFWVKLSDEVKDKITAYTPMVAFTYAYIPCPYQITDADWHHIEIDRVTYFWNIWSTYFGVDPIGLYTKASGATIDYRQPMVIVANFNMSMTPEGVYDDNGKLMLYSKYTASETNFKRIKNKLKFNGNVDLSKIDSEQLAMWFNQTTPDIEEVALVNGTETYPNILMDKNGNILYTV